MDRTAGLISIAAIASAFGAGCGSFHAADTAGDAGSTPAIGSLCSDLKPFSEGFDAEGWAAGWDANGSNLHVRAAPHQSAPNALVLELPSAAKGGDESWLGRPLARCNLRASAWVYFQGPFGDGEVDFFGVTDGSSHGAPGIVLVATASNPGAIAIEDTENGTSATSIVPDTWSFVEIEIDPVGHRFSTRVDRTTVREGVLAPSFPTTGLVLKVGASWISGPPTKPWTVYFDDVAVSAP